MRAVVLALPVFSCVVHSSQIPVKEPLPPPEGDAYVAGDPIRCSGSRDVSVEGVHIHAPDIGVKVTGSCRVVIKNSRIDAGDIGIKVTGSGSVYVTGSIVAGQNLAVAITGSGSVTATTTRFFGGKRVVGSGSIHDDGSSIWEP